MGSSFDQRMYDSYVSSGQAGAPSSLAGFGSVAPFLKRVVRRHFPASREAAILDLGCGHGDLVHFAREAGYRNMVGVDRSAEQVQAATRLGIEGISQGDAMAALAALPDGSQDLVAALDLLEHLEKDDLFPLADEVLRVLRPGGRFIVTVPNGESPLFGRVRYGDLTHRRAFTRVSMAQFLNVVGFREVECFEKGPLPHGLPSLVRWLLWKTIRALLSVYVAAETGELGGGIFTQNFTTVATK